jgi:hypothetical protein
MCDIIKIQLNKDNYMDDEMIAEGNIVAREILLDELAACYQVLTQDDGMNRDMAFEAMLEDFSLPEYVTYEYLENNL